MAVVDQQLADTATVASTAPVLGLRIRTAIEWGESVLPIVIVPTDRRVRPPS